MESQQRDWDQENFKFYFAIWFCSQVFWTVVFWIIGSILNINWPPFFGVWLLVSALAMFVFQKGPSERENLGDKIISAICVVTTFFPLLLLVIVVAMFDNEPDY